MLVGVLEKLQSWLPTALILTNASAVLAGAVIDLFYRKIPNIHVLIVALCAITFTALFHTDQLFFHLLNFLYVAGVGIILFRKKVLGGGDVKFIAALALWFMPQQLGLFVFSVLICGGILGSIYLAFCLLHLVCVRYFPKIRVPAVKADAGMPYGVATAVGFAFASLRVMS